METFTSCGCTLLGLGLFTGHICFTKSDISRGVQRCLDWCQPQVRPKGPDAKIRRHEEGFMEKQFDMIISLNKGVVHLAFLFLCSALWMLQNRRDEGTGYVAITSFVVYASHGFLSRVRLRSKSQVNCLKLAFQIPHVLILMSILHETDITRLSVAEKLILGGTCSKPNSKQPLDKMPRLHTDHTVYTYIYIYIYIH